MAFNRKNLCYSSCPASTVTIQPPPIVLTIPGPSLYCPDQPLYIEQYNPCAQDQKDRSCCGYGASSATATSSSHTSSSYFQKEEGGLYDSYSCK